MDFDKLLDQIESETEIANQDLDSVDPRVRPYKKGQIQSAKGRLEELYLEYKNEMLRRSVFILVTGDQSESFADIAQKNFKCFKVDGKIMFKEVVDQLDPQLYINKSVNASLFDIVGNVLEDKMKNLDIVSYNSLTFSARFSRVLKTKGDMIDLVKEAVSSIVGGEIVGLDALERVAKEAVNVGYKSKMVPILIHTNDEEFVNSISDSLRKINPRVVRIGAGKLKLDINALTTLEEVDEESVGEALKQIATKA